MTRTQISLEEKQYLEAKKYAEDSGISLAEFLRQSISEKLVAYRKNGPVSRFAGIYDGSSDDSASIDEVVYKKGHF